MFTSHNYRKLFLWTVCLYSLPVTHQDQTVVPYKVDEGGVNNIPESLISVSGDDEEDDFFLEENIVKMSKENIGLLPPNASDTDKVVAANLNTAMAFVDEQEMETEKMEGSRRTRHVPWTVVGVSTGFGLIGILLVAAVVTGFVKFHRRRSRSKDVEEEIQESIPDSSTYASSNNV